jgi:alcohol dehydrogenase class IV
MPAWEEFLGKPTRQYIETVFSGLSAILFSRKIHAVTPRGFELKIIASCWLSSFSACRGQLRLYYCCRGAAAHGRALVEADGTKDTGVGMLEAGKKLSGTYRDQRTWEILFGAGQLDQLPGLLEERGWTRVLLLTPRSMARSGLVQRLISQLGRFMIGHLTSRQHTPLSTVAEGTNIFEETAANCLISIGGGSTVDMAKGIALSTSSPGDLATFKGRPTSHNDGLFVETRQKGDRKIPPIVAVPTTLSGAEFTYQTGLTDDATGRKDQYYSSELLPRLIILDPKATLPTPNELWVSSGIKALDHAVERWYSRYAQPFSDALSAHATKTVFALLPMSLEAPEDLNVRTQLLLTAWMAQFATGNVPVGIGHAIDHQLCAIYDIPHGIAPCVVLPVAMEFNQEFAKHKLEEMSALIGRSEISCESAIIGVRELVARLGLPVRLRDVGVDKRHFNTIAERTLTDTAIIGNPRPVEDSEIVKELLERAW